MKIKFMSYEYEIELTDKKVFTNYYNGHVSVDHQLVTIAKNLSPTKLQHSLFHEMVHIVEKELSVELDEKQVSVLSEGMFHILKENGLLKDFDFTSNSKKSVTQSTEYCIPTVDELREQKEYCAPTAYVG